MTAMVIQASSGLRVFVAVYIAVLALLLTAPVGTPHRKQAYLTEFPAGKRRVTTDVAVNILAFVPLGFGLQRMARDRRGWLAAVVVATLIGAGFSLIVETYQYFQLVRYSSLLDVVCNALGTLIGALVACLVRRPSAFPAVPTIKA